MKVWYQKSVLNGYVIVTHLGEDENGNMTYDMACFENMWDAINFFRS